MVNRKRPTKEQIKHDEEVCIIAEELVNQGNPVGIWGKCGVREDLKMNKYDGKWADIETEHRGERRIIEVESESSISHESTREQLEAFTKYHTTEVWVPKGYRRLMKRNLKKWGINRAKVYTY